MVWTFIVGIVASKHKKTKENKVFSKPRESFYYVENPLWGRLLLLEEPWNTY